MTVIATVGLPGSGKSEAARVAAELDIPILTMGDVIREETRKRGLDPHKDHGSVATSLREEEGVAAVANRSIPMIESYLREYDAVFIDGIRSDAEVDRFVSKFGDDFHLISIEAPAALRQKRITTRGRDQSAADGGEDLSDRDRRELGFGMGEAMERADAVVSNDSSLTAFRSEIRTLLKSYLPDT